MTDKISIKKTVLFCSFCGKKLKKYEYDTDIQQQCYAYCSACKREYHVTIISIGTRAVCTGCGDEKRLHCLEVLEFLPLKQGGSEKRV